MTRSDPTLAQHEPALRALAARLIEKEVVDREMLASLLADVEPSAARAPVGRAAAIALTHTPSGLGVR